MTIAATSDIVQGPDGSMSASSAGQALITCGEHEPWCPELLVLTGAALSLASTVQRLALHAGVEVVGYASRQHVMPSIDGAFPDFGITVSLAVRSEEDAARVRALLAAAIDQSPLVKVLRISVTPRVTVPVAAVVR